MSKKLLVTFAFPDERIEIKLPGWEVETCITRITQPYAAATLAKAIVTRRPDCVLNVGTAGTLIHNVGDIIASTHFVNRDILRQQFESVSAELTTCCPLKDMLPTELAGKAVPGVFTVNTGDDFVTAADKVEGDVIDMEAFAEALLCHTFDIPFAAVKYVTDVVGQNSLSIWAERLSAARAALTDYFTRVADRLPK